MLRFRYDPAVESLLRVFEDRGALLSGHFLLTSGLHSARYLQCARVLMDPALATELGAQLAARLRPKLGEAPLAVVAPALGGVIVAHEVARAFGCMGLFTERQDGAMTLRRGFTLAEGDPVLVVEDVVTTGGAAVEAVEALREAGLVCRTAICVVDREEGGVGGLAAAGVRLVPLFRASEVLAQGVKPHG